MDHRPAARTDARRVLVSVTNAREVIRAGFGGAQLRVRTLDQLSCRVHAGELLILRGSVASGALALLRALHGSSPRIRAEHVAAPQVQLRRATISAVAARAIEAGWLAEGAAANGHGVEPSFTPPAAVAVPRSGSTARTPVVYLLRVRPQARHERADITPTHGDDQHGAALWREWANDVRRTGGAVVLAAQSEPSFSTDAQTRPTMRGARSGTTVVRERRPERSGHIRRLVLHAGQIVNADPDETLPC
jgi:hypothetical protein